MKTRNFVTVILAIGLIAGASAFKMEICHNENNNPVTIRVAVPSAIAHIVLHGDSKRPCGISDEDESRSSSR